MSTEPSTSLLHLDPAARTEQFKDSPVGRVPEEWDIRALGDLLILIRNGTTAEQVARPTPYPVSRIETIADGSIDWMRVGYLEADLLDYRMQPGDILYSHINSVAHMGKVAIYDGSGLLYHGMNLMLLRVDNRKCIPRFLYAVLASDRGRAHARRECKSAVNQASLGRKDITRFLVQVPPLPDQSRIVTVLDTVDEAIAKTEVVIAKLKQVRAGLLHDLLTRGLDEDGQLRNPISHPEQFQGSQLGCIPCEWRVRRLCEVATFQNGKAFPSADYREMGIRLLRPGNLPPSEFVTWEPGNTTCLPEPWVHMAGEYLVGGDELVMNLTAQSLEEQFLGRVCMTRPGEQCLLNQRLARFRPLDCNLAFLFWSLRGPFFRSQIDRNPQGTKVQHIYNRDLESVVLPLPERQAEQELIASVLFSAARQIDSENWMLAKFQKLKSGLMTDLLTGRVRVPEGIAVEL